MEERPEAGPPQLYFRQLLAGRDFARATPLAAQMRNFVYAIGDRSTGECVLVDPAWSVRELVEAVEEDGLRVIGALATHYHPDHIGGDLLGHALVEGLEALLELRSVPIHVQRTEQEWIRKSTALGAGDLTLHDSGDLLDVGSVPVTLVHTPGHTPGSQCFLVGDRLVAGDTLFLDGCGRTDLPGGDAAEIHRSIHERLAHVPDRAVLYPGHLYGPAASASMGATRKRNPVFRIPNVRDWLRLQG